MSWAFMRQHQMVSISLLSSDEPVDLVKDGFDLTIRLDIVACLIVDLAAWPWFDPPLQVCAEKRPDDDVSLPRSPCLSPKIPALRPSRRT